MTKYTTDTSCGTTMSEKQLFSLFLNTSPSKALLPENDECLTLKELYFSDFDCASLCLPNSVGNEIIQALCMSDEPASELKQVVEGLSRLGSRFQILSGCFSKFADITRLEEAEDVATDEDYFPKHSCEIYAFPQADVLPGSN